MANRVTPPAPPMTEREARVACSALRAPYRDAGGDGSHPAVLRARATLAELEAIERAAPDPLTALARMEAHPS